MSDYTVKGLKTWHTSEGGGFEVVLCRDGRPVATVLNEGVGAVFIFRWKDPTPATVEAVLHDGTRHSYRGCRDEAELWAHVRDLPPMTVGGESTAFDPDMFVEELVNDLELSRQVKRWMTKPTAVTPDGRVLQLNLPLARAPSSVAAQARQQLLREHPGATYISDLPLAEAVAAVRRVQSY